MTERINQTLAKGYAKASWLKLRAKRGFQGLMSDERGLSGVVVAVLLILIAVLAIVMLWGSLKKFLGDKWKDISGAEFEDGNNF